MVHPLRSRLGFEAASPHMVDDASFPSLLLPDTHGRASHGLLRRLVGTHHPPPLFSSRCPSERQRPFGGLVELAEQAVYAVGDLDPWLVGRYSLVLVNLLPGLRRRRDLRKVRRLRSGLADYVFRGDDAGLKHFYWQRDIGPWMAADLVHFLIAAARTLHRHHGQAPVMWLEDLHFADPKTLQGIHLLASYGRHEPIHPVVCGTLSTEQVQILEGESPQPLWQSTTSTETFPPAESDLAGLPEEAMPLLSLAATALSPWTLDDLHRWMDEDPPSLEPTVISLSDAGILRPLGTTHWTMTSGALRDALVSRLDTPTRQTLHAVVGADESADPFLAVCHGLQEGQEKAPQAQAALGAAERAWAVSDCDLAQHLYEHALHIASQPEALSHHMMSGLLAYDAGRHQDADTHFSTALAHAPKGHAKHHTLVRLLGFNAIFGLGHFDRGREVLQPLLDYHEAEGMESHAGYLRNALAYALFRAGHYDDAVDMERQALAQLRQTTANSAFLFSVLQLNLGRLFRQMGFSEEALELFIRSMDEDFSPFMLQIFYTTLAQLHQQRGEPRPALMWHYLGFELTRDLDLENVSYPVLNTLKRPVSVDGLMSRGDEVFFYIYLHLALSCRHLALTDRVEAYVDAMRRHWDTLPERIWKEVEEAIQHVEPQAMGNDAPGMLHFADEARSTSARFPDLVTDISGGRPLHQSVVDSLRQGRSVALFRPRAVGPGRHLTDCVVLFDPRQQEQMQRLGAEIGVATGFFPPDFPGPGATARAALMLPSAMDRFESGLRDIPLLLQEATVAVDARGELSALGPHRVRCQVLHSELDGFLYRILQEFEQQTGLGILATVPFHLRRRSMPSTPQQALHGFLASPVDDLALGDQHLTKRLGATDPENLLPFRPCLSLQASILASQDPDAAEFQIRIRNFAYQSDLKLRRELQPLLTLSDGERSIREILTEVDSPFDDQAMWRQQACGLYRKLWRQGAISFRPPAVS